MPQALPLLMLHTGLVYFILVNADLQYYSPEAVAGFIEKMSNTSGVTEKCSISLRKVRQFLSAYDTLEAQKSFFVSSFAVGKSDDVQGRDQFRWAFNMRKCYRVAAEQSYSVSEYPTDYCFVDKIDAENSTAFGICIPGSCEDDRQTLVLGWQNEFINVPEHAKPHSLWCGKSRKKVPWYQQPIAIVDYSYSLVGLLVVGLATAFHLNRHTNNKLKASTAAKFFLAFSMKKNGKRLIALPKNSESTITCMFGIRFITMAWIILGHIYIVLPSYMEDLTEYRRDPKQFLHQYGANPTLSVDTFFMLGGLLISYLYFRNHSKKSKSMWTSPTYWLKFVAYRALRLWPAYMFSMLNFTFRWSEFSINTRWPGNFVSATCAKDWWKNLLFLNGILPSSCMAWTWYISTAFIYSLISPFYFAAFEKSVAFGYALSLITILASSAWNIVAMIRFGFPPMLIPFDSPPPYYVDNLHEQNATTYIRPDYRIGPYMVGLIVGTLLDKAKKRGWHMTKTKAVFGWLLAFLAGFCALFGSYPIMQGWNWRIYELAFGGFHRTVWSCFAAWVVYSCHIGCGGIINRFLSSRLFIPLSNMCYSVYLLHAMGIIAVLDAKAFPVQYPGKLGMVWLYLLALAFSFLIGLITVFLVEYPADNIVKLFFSTKRAPESANKSDHPLIEK